MMMRRARSPVSMELPPRPVARSPRGTGSLFRALLFRVRGGRTGIDSWCQGKLLSCISLPGTVELKCLDVFPPLLKKIVFFFYINMETLPFPLPSALEQPRSLDALGPRPSFTVTVLASLLVAPEI